MHSRRHERANEEMKGVGVHTRHGGVPSLKFMEASSLRASIRELVILDRVSTLAVIFSIVITWMVGGGG